jgi:hypothetical protein
LRQKLPNHTCVEKRNNKRKETFVRLPSSLILKIQLGLISSMLASCANDEPEPTATTEAVRPAAAATSASVVFRVTPSKTIVPVPSRFTGISFETGDITSFPNPVLEQMIKNNYGTLRIGGSSTDISCLSADYSGPYCKISLTPERIKNVVDAAKRMSYPLSFGVNFLRPKSVVNQAKVLRAAGVNEIELGNEPDLYGIQGSRPAAYTFADYKKEFKPVRASLKGIDITGPSVCCRFKATATENELTQFALSEDVQKITAHPYASAFCDKTKPAPTAAYLLSADRITAMKTRFAGMGAAVKPRPVFFNETNSTACGGSPGVSNSMAAALWLVDWGFEAMKLGISGINVHNAGTLYAPILVDKATKTAKPNPVYYGMLMLSQAQGQNLVEATKTKGQPNIKIWATKRTDGQLRVYILNKDTSFSGDIEINIEGKTTSANLFTMGGASLGATTGVKFGTQAVGPTGTFSLSKDATVVPTGSLYKIKLSNGKAVMLII